MNEKEVAEIRRRFNSQRTNISSVRGCCVSASGEIIGEFSQPLATLTPDEADALLAVLKKTLSGGINRNLVDIEFSNEEVLGGDRHKRLLKLRDSALNDEESINALYGDIISAYKSEGSFLILLAHECYDVFTYTKDGFKGDESGEQFRYFVCCVCPIKLTKPLLSFMTENNSFKNLAANSVVGAPDIGFMFPAFDDRCGNIYNALFYEKNISADYSDIAERLFGTGMPMPAAQQKDSFDGVLSRSLEDDCTLETIKAVRGRVDDMVTEHKENRETEPLTLSRDDISGILMDCDVKSERIGAFKEEYDRAFGAEARLSPANIVDTKKLEIKTDDVTVKINPERDELIKTTVIDGVNYLLIRADSCFEVNGIKLSAGTEENKT